MDFELILQALGEQTRYKIFQLLLDDEYCVGGLAKTLKISDSAVSQHVSILKEANIVIGKKVGYYTHLTVNRDSLNEFLEWFAKRIIKED